ncbi:MAG: hypothetical protein OEN23_02435 [Paracoccaceae bacterium]|nr:hypothetical protein [Paracoccaceae bacterium]
MGHPIEAENAPVSSPRPAIPIVERYRATVTEEEVSRVDELAQKLMRDDPSICRADLFGPGVDSGLNDGPAILVGDQREIGLHESLREQMLEHRIGMLAGADDTLVVERASPVHEAYIRQLLGIEGFRVAALGPPSGRPRPIAARCRDSDVLLQQFADTARAAGRFQIVPHIGAGSAWALAGAIARKADVPVLVSAPPPRLTRRVNDKIWFSNRVRQLLGKDALPPTSAAFGPAAIAAKIARIARNSNRVIVKTPNSAGSMGNVAIDADLVRRLSAANIRKLVLSMLRGRGWRGRYPVLVGLWESDILASPSVQLWIPLLGQGHPVIDGVFEQRLAGPTAEFVGAVPSQMPRSFVDRMAGQAMRLARLFQTMGYFGRCSLDCLITSPSSDAQRIHWVECNGRWGGVSVPMTLANRLRAPATGQGIVIVQNMNVPLAVNDVSETHERLGNLLFRSGSDEGIVPLSANCLEKGLGLHFMALSETQEKAETIASEALARLRKE